MNLLNNWDPDKNYSEMSLIRFLGRGHLLTNPNRLPDSTTPPITSNKIPLKRLTVTNGIKTRSNVQLIEELLTLFPENPEDTSNSWRKL